MVAFLVAIAVRGLMADQIYDVLAAGPVSPALLRHSTRNWRRMDDPQRLVAPFKTERAISAGWDDVMMGQPYPLLAHAFGWVLKSYQIGAIDFSESICRWRSSLGMK